MRIKRYIFLSLLEVFGATIAVLFGVMLIIQWITLGKALSMSDMDVLLLTMVPLSSFVIPMGLLFTILIVLEKLSIESEIIAMKACGVKSLTIYLPVVFMSFSAMLLHMFISTNLGPMAMKTVQTRLLQSASQKIFSFLKEREFDNSFKGLVVYVESVNPKEKEFKNVFIETSGNERSVITSERGTIEVKNNSIIMKLKNGSVYMHTNLVDRYLTFDEYRFSLDADFTKKLRIKSYDSATQAEFRRLIKINPDPQRIKQYYNRISFPVLDLILGLVGISFGIVRPRSPRHTGFIIGIGTIVGYYFLFTFADRLVKANIMAPLLGAWLPNIVFCLILCGVLLYRKLRLSEGGI
jgi:lipopolysaccharide export system permease protein